jgi:hypothetical protein
MGQKADPQDSPAQGLTGLAQTASYMRLILCFVHLPKLSSRNGATRERVPNIDDRASAGCRQLGGERIREGQDRARACPPAGRVEFAMGVLDGLVL